jgi:sentrin-specific protease 7
MQWISRDINFNCKSTDVHFFTSHFHSTLASGGVERVKSWTARKNINIFEKKLIFIPINKTLHWSLCVIVNPGAVENSNLISEEDDKEDPPLSCMLFFDSLKLHNKQRSQRLLLQWLNSEWQRVNDISSTPFTKKNYRIYDPEGMFELLCIVL